MKNEFKPARQPRLETGVRNMDAILHGGLPDGAVVVLAGTPGSGKTIFSHQLGFHNAKAGAKVVYFQTLSEPTAKRLRYLDQFTFFDPAKIEDGSVRFIDLGVLLKTEGLTPALKIIMDHVRNERPNFVVIDSFKAFGDLTTSKEELRKFSYEIAISLMAWECSALLLGEFGVEDIQTNPLFSVVDGLIWMGQKDVSEEPQRFLHVIKMRGTDHNRRRHAFTIGDEGINIYAPRATIRRDSEVELRIQAQPRCQPGIPRLQEFLADGIPRGTSVLVSGATGTGKTVMLLEFLYRGAKEFGEKGVMFTFEETPERLIATGKSLGWDLAGEIARGMIELVFIPQTDIAIDENLQLIHETITRVEPRRVSFDSLSVFLHKSPSPLETREKAFQLTTIVQMAGAVGLFASKIHAESDDVSHFGIEETIADGVFLLTSERQGNDRRRFFEIYKMRNTSHVMGRHAMDIGQGGILITPRPESGPARG